jgi:hypothetical protein
MDNAKRYMMLQLVGAGHAVNQELLQIQTSLLQELLLDEEMQARFDQAFEEKTRIALTGIEEQVQQQLASQGRAMPGNRTKSGLVVP